MNRVLCDSKHNQENLMFELKSKLMTRLFFSQLLNSFTLISLRRQLPSQSIA